MKKLLLLMFITMNMLQANTHDQLVNAIIESDYETFAKMYETNSISEQERNVLFELADQAIPFRQRWVVEHAQHPQVGKEIFVAAGWALGAYFGGAACALGAAALIQQDQNPLFPIVLGLTIVPPCVYFAIKNTIEAWQKPKKLLANAMRIKDYLFNK